MQESSSMNGKSYEGLTLDGMAAHIANAILLMNRKVGSKNDCKLVTAHVLRQYQGRLMGRAPEDVPYTQAALEAKKKGEYIELEHAIPIGCLMNVLFHYANGITHEEVTEQVKSIVANNTILAWVTPKEHTQLNKRHQSFMPVGFDTYPWKDVWARYVAACVPLPEGVLSPESLESRLQRKPSEDASSDI
jgi:hypothetical protein